jgi:DNA-directed RNA polymerase subunit beta
MEYPDFLDIQVKSFQDFFQLKTKADERSTEGLYKTFLDNFPITDTRNNFVLEFLDYFVDPPRYTIQECIERGLTYCVPLKARLKLYCTDPEHEDFETIVQDVYLGTIPYMTHSGTFVINGAERVIVSQLHRSPGVFFGQSFHANGTKLYSARVIPFKGSWIEFATDINQVMYAYIDRKKKLPVTTLFRAIGYERDKDILEIFNLAEEVKVSKSGIKKVLGRKLAARVLKTWFEDFVDEDTGEVVSIERNEIILDRDTVLEKEHIDEIVESGSKTILLHKEDNQIAEYSIIHNTLQKDPTNSEKEAVEHIYRQLRNAEPPDFETAKGIIDKLFFSEQRYNLGEVGRYRMNKKLELNESIDQKVLTKLDIITIIKNLIKLVNSKAEVDDIDHLSNRRVRTVGEQMASQFGVGLSRMARTIRERMNVRDNEVFTPIDLINAKTLSSVINSFFGTNQLSQFMDQTNPLAEITHKRRLSALGPGGLSRERAGFEVRDVHYTHYGRLCPIETPEGPNIGLISSLAVYAKVNNLGFIETPYREVLEGKVNLNELPKYLSAEEEEGKKFAQSNLPLDTEGNFVSDRVIAREEADYPVVEPNAVNYMDVAPNQIASISASLIPFLEHDDANRALMGSNMMRQAVPLLRPNAPIVGTGLEKTVARDAWEAIKAKRTGIVEKADAKNIYVRGEDENGAFIDHYSVNKNVRTNNNTSFGQRIAVQEGEIVEKGQVIADGPSMDKGELAVGVNACVAFMPWNGYNYEDAIVLSQRLIKEDAFTSVHIYEKEVECRELKHGNEEITRDLPGVKDESITHLDESGIVKVGTFIKPGMIMVGKVTPKGEIKPTPEERLLRAIFGEKAGHVINKSLYCPTSMEGTVVDVKVFTKKGYEKDSRAVAEIESEKAELDLKHHDKLLMLDREEILKINDLLSKALLAKDVDLDDVVYKKGETIPLDILSNVNRFAMKKVVSSYDKDIEKKYNDIKEYFINQKSQLRADHEEKLEVLEHDDILQSGVIKQVKVYIATKRKIKVGDKMAGRHGNKGIVSNIVPQVDMPYLEDGSTVDVILNPLGVPSRMNIGQILEVHLGLVGKRLGTQIQDIFDAKRTEFVAELRAKMTEIADITKLMNGKEFLSKLSDEELIKHAQDWTKGVRFATQVFDGVKEDEFLKLFELAKIDTDGKTNLIDGKTGDKMKERVNVGYMYMLKLHHLVDEKVHARSTGPYSLVTQQPVGGKALFGGQRFGEMEVWALEAYGATAVLKEMLTTKSDDVEGRTRAYRAISNGENVPDSGVPETFFVLTKELKALGLDVEIFDEVENNE